MTKRIAEKVVIGAGVLGLLFVCIRAIRLLLTGAVLTRERLSNSGDNDPGK